MSRARPDYGIDSPAIIVGELALGAGALGLAAASAALRIPRPLGAPLVGVGLAAGAYLTLSAGGMVYYSKVGKLRLRDHLLRRVPWRGDERVLDVGCGRGLLLVGAARHLTSGKAVGVDRWIHGALSGNRPEAALRNAALAGVADRVEVREGDARRLPFGDDAFDVVVSNFVLHELDSAAERHQMLREIVRVLRPGGRIALADFVFTGEAVRVLRECGIADAHRTPLGGAYFWWSAVTSLGLVQLRAVTGCKPTGTPANA